MITHIEKDCQWRNFNLSTKRESQFVNTYCKYTILYKVTPSQYEYSLVHS